MLILSELSFPETVTSLHLRIQQHSLPPTVTLQVTEQFADQIATATRHTATLILNLGTRHRLVVSLTLRSFNLRGNSHPFQSNRMLGGLQTGVGVLEKRKICCLYGSQTLFHEHKPYQLCPVHPLTPHLFQTHLNITVPPTPRFKCSSFRHPELSAYLVCPMRSTCLGLV
jgi:hypothetical protein